MAQRPKSIKYKVIGGYLLLSAVAVIAVWFVYHEIKHITGNNRLSDENTKIIRVSNTIASLYASEALGRSAILSAEKKELNRYYQVTDSILNDVQSLKSIADPSLQKKLNRVNLLISRRRNSITEIYKFRQAHPDDEYYTKSIAGLKTAKDSVWKHTKSIKGTKKNSWEKLTQELLAPQQYDSLGKLVSDDTITVAYEKMLTSLREKNLNKNTELYKKEQKMLRENRIISEEIRVILTSIEKEFVKKSYDDIKQTSAALNKTVNTLAWGGAGAFLLLIILAWIIIRDLSINQRYRRELELLNQENEELLRTKGMLMATVTHDLQTPLGSILGFQELLKNSGVNTAQGEYLDNIKESAGYIVKLVNDLLDFSKLENNRISIEHIPTNLKHTIETTCNALTPMAEQKGIELWWDTDDCLDTFVITDPYRIKQVLTNLVSNAIKFTHEGSVEITGKVDENNIVLSIIDTGIGIAPNKHGAVFKEFTQAHDGIEKKFGGTGLGLTISKRIVELLGGSILLESEEGKGTIFTITLPYVPAPADAIANISSDKKQPETKNAEIKGKRILVIDDDTTQLRLMKELLEKSGAEVTTEANSLTALKLIEEKTFDTVLTDLQMPVMDGFALVASIRSNENLTIAQLPVIVLSGRRDIEESEFTAKGFTAQLTKPVNITLLTQLISGNNAGKENTAQELTLAGKKSEKLFDLASLIPFTQNDPESLKLIIDTFVESTTDNCRELLAAAEANDENRLSRIAHKMIPMLLQMEVYSIASLLSPLEEKTLMLPPTKLNAYCNDIYLRMEELCAMLQKETA
jgi:signal transduction histidine kinase/CheY-like chemotaxis protein